MEETDKKKLYFTNPRFFCFFGSNIILIIESRGKVPLEPTNPAMAAYVASCVLWSRASMLATGWVWSDVVAPDPRVRPARQFGVF